MSGEPHHIDSRLSRSVDHSHSRGQACPFSCSRGLVYSSASRVQKVPETESSIDEDLRMISAPGAARSSDSSSRAVSSHLGREIILIVMNAFLGGEVGKEDSSHKRTEPKMVKD
ncbi:hypothetical protein BaRGS_00035454 [Batillaria attramentaria]|uniref:Uncharacterized protein n=1 Tax=Batillaria attramentaria TaxID=370345 RepID=A0ABD0JES0_9CAEN